MTSFVRSEALRSDQWPRLRWLGVATAIVILLPWLGVIIWSLSHADEYHRRIVLVGTSVAFIADVLVQIGFNEIGDAHLVSPTPYLFPPSVLPVAMGIWVISVGLTWLYYRASQ